MNPKAKATLLLFVATFIWGFSYPINRHALVSMNPWTFSSLRYFFATVALLPLVVRWGHRKAPADYFTKVSKWMWLWAGLSSGALLCLGSGFQYYGLTSTTAGKSGFITALYVSMVPVFGFIMGLIPRKPVWIGLAVCFVGIFLIGDPGSKAGFNRGDALTLVADLFWATHVLIMGFFTKRVNPWRYVTAQSAFGCILCFIMAILTNHPPTMVEFKQFWPSILWGVMSVSLAYVCQAVAQKNTSATAAALIMQFQSVIAALCGVIFLGETVSKMMLIGAVFLVAGTLTAQLAADPSRLTPQTPHFKQLQVARVVMAIFVMAVCGGAVFLTKGQS